MPVASETKPTVDNSPVGARPQVPQEMLDGWKEQAGNTHNKQVLLNALREVQTAIAADPDPDVAALLETKKFSVHSQSTFGRANQLKPAEQLPVAWFLREHLQHVPNAPAQLSNLIDVMENPLPQPPVSGNGWGALATLNSGQLSQLRDLASAEMTRASLGSGMFKAFHDKYGASVQGKGAAEVLETMIASPEAQALGQRLKAGSSSLPISASPAELAMAAMVLELDPQAGSKRGVVAGYALYQSTNWGVSPSVVIERLAQHLVGQGKVPAELAPAAARLLLAGTAPTFLVVDMPDNLVVGSAAWAKLQTVVEAEEFWAPGIAAQTGFQAFMQRADYAPVSDAQAIVQGKAQSHALVEWGIAQGRISRKNDGVYTLAEVAGLRDAFNEELSVLKKAQEQLGAIMPSRKDMAIEQLQSVYGANDPFDVRNISITQIDASESEDHSLLDIYMAGKMDRIPKGPRYDFQLGNRFLAVRPLPDINQRFNSEFDAYFRNLKEGVTTTVKHQLSQLPLEDRQTIASGKVEFFSLRKASTAQAEGDESAAEAQAAKARYGLLMRVESKINKDGSDLDAGNIRHAYYEVFPLQGVIRRRDDLPRHLPNPAPRVTDPENYATRQAKGVSVAVDYEAYERGTQPQRDKVGEGLLTESVRGPHLPELRPTQDASAAVHANPRFSLIADTVASHLLHDRDGIKAGARGVTEVEKEEADIQAGFDFVTGLIPFKNAIENAVKGNTGAAIRDFALDIFGFVVPFGKGVGVAANHLSKGVGKLGTRAFSASAAFTQGVFNGLNPADGLGNLLVGLARGGKTLLQKSYRELKELLPVQHFNFPSFSRAAGSVDNAVFERYAVNRTRLAGLTPDSDGVYRAADNRLFIRIANDSGEATVFQVREVNNHQGVVQARLIDPLTNRQTEFLLQKNGPDQWSRLGLPGGAPGASTFNQLTHKRPYAQSYADGVSGAPSAAKRPRVPESFPGEKADLKPPVKGENVFYHYTNDRSHAGISASRTLDPSSSTLTGQKLPRNQGRHYFTNLAPGDKPIKEISEIIFGRRKYGNATDKMTHYYEVNTTGLNLVKSPDNPHIFYLETPFAIPLKYRNGGPELVDRVIKHGVVPA